MTNLVRPSTYIWLITLEMSSTQFFFCILTPEGYDLLPPLTITPTGSASKMSGEMAPFLRVIQQIFLWEENYVL